MNVTLHNQAKQILEMERIPDNSGGVFQDGQVFVWFTFVNGNFDCGEEKTFNEALTKLKTNGKQ